MFLPSQDSSLTRLVKIEWTILERESKNGRTFKDIAYEVHETFKIDDGDDEEGIYEE